MVHTSNCMICGGELKYSSLHEEKECYYCKDKLQANAECVNGHYVCDKCHSATANSIIKRYCLGTDITNPLIMVNEIMNHPSINMHGPEHHFLIPAVLITAYYNATNQQELIKEKLEEVEKRAEKILGGFCGFYGACGAGIGAGIAVSIITNATPLTSDSWRLSNLITSKTLNNIAEAGGPRCCKRTTYISLIKSVEFIESNFNVILGKSKDIICSHNKRNKECIGNKCNFFIRKKGL
ncbi:MAG: SAM-dependent methyltransferase [Bacteroidetes bacterium GWE2_29_8]|nr:MAG: SAM-dependent methyltransferase [Bacteroidetes bacterium GWE2_29_8]